MSEPLEPVIATEAHGLRFLGGMPVILRSIEGAVDQARERVLVETYIYRNDRLGHDFAARLARAAERGLDVRLLYDPLGSQRTSRKLFDDLRARGVGVQAYRVPGRGTVRPFPRDHGRVMVVDGHAWTGGAAWGDEWLPARHGGQGWWDVCVEVEHGPVVEDFARLFEMRWGEAAGGDAPCDLDTGDRHPDLTLVADCPAERSLVFDRHVERITGARSRVWLEHAYFFPPKAMLRALTDAARRGVDVRVVMPAESDLPILARAARGEYAQWLAAGLRLFHYRRSMLHSKFAVVDDDWCTIGTFNANPTSVGLANEVNLFVRDRRFVARAAAQFEEDLRGCYEVDARWVEQRKLGRRVVDRMAADLLSLADRVFAPRRAHVR
jgi:cardiolipin synthase